MDFGPGVPVRSVDNPGRHGVVTNSPPRQRPSGPHVHVRWADATSDYVHVDELELLDRLATSDPYSLIRDGRYGRTADLRRNLTYAHLSGRLANLVYAMGITNTDFYAHQYRPLLTLLESPANGLLIADEVGLGKTIEAGLIWTELRARFDFRRLVVVCPAMLREKWQTELRLRFGVDASRVDAATLLEELSQPAVNTGEGKAFIVSYQAARPPREWTPAAQPPERPGARWQLADFLHASADQIPPIDLVVFDEAHYMRNTDTAAWQLGDLLRESSSYQLMLSATPINLRNRDLFNLLRLIDPDHFVSEDDFRRLIETNRPLVATRDLVLDRRSNADQIREALNQASREPFLAGSQQLAAILADPPDDVRLANPRYRAELADSLERINLLSHIITRTRKRDVEERRVRRSVQREAVPMTDAERTLYEAVTEATRAYALRNGISDGFLLATPQRMVASCPAAIAEAWLGDAVARGELEEDVQSEFEDELPESTAPSNAPLRATLAAVVPRAVDVARLRQQDSKFDRLMDVAARFLADHPGEKIVLFTTYRATARYLATRMTAQGLPARLLMGGQAQSKQETIDQFRNTASERVLVSTEVAAEGVDLQFCRVLVNYDLPWNPTRVEQRIGRIDRLGQKAELIHVWNLYFQNTIDERIVSRLLDRLRIFEESLGEAEPIVGEEIRRLEADLLSRRLTAKEEEERIEQTAQALENLRIQREQLEQNAAHMMAHGQRVIERIEAARELSRRVTEEDLVVYVRDYLTAHASGHRFAVDVDDAHLITIQLPPELCARFNDFLTAENLQGKTFLHAGLAKQCKFLNRISESGRRGEEVIHQFHPLIRYITRDLRERSEHFYPVVALRTNATDGVPGGRFVFCARSWVFKGVRDEEYLAIAVADLNSGRVLEEDESERLLHAARLGGVEWLEASGLDQELVQRRLEEAENVLEGRFTELKVRKQNENGDRARFQLDSIQRHLDRRINRWREVRDAHIALGRASLAAATQGRIDTLTSRMAARKERILQQERVVADKAFICAGVIEVA